jgi:hypothetical protein
VPPARLVKLHEELRWTGSALELATKISKLSRKKLHIAFQYDVMVR